MSDERLARAWKRTAKHYRAQADRLWERTSTLAAQERTARAAERALRNLLAERDEEIDRLRAGPVAAADGALREAADFTLQYWRIWQADNGNEDAMFHLKVGMVRLASALSRVPSSVAASGGEP